MATARGHDRGSERRELPVQATHPTVVAAASVSGTTTMTRKRTDHG